MQIGSVYLTSDTSDAINHAVNHLLANGVVTASICLCQYIVCP
jgi:hypothetical protein